MKDFPSCFSENAVQVSDASCSNASKTAQNMVTSIYQCILFGQSCLVTITWSKNIIGQCLSVEIYDLFSQCLGKFDIKPWLFSKRKGFKSLELNPGTIEIFWDLSSAKFGSGPEPLEEFYFAMVFNGEITLLLGDLRKEACKKTNANLVDSDAVFISKREHIFGKKVYATKVLFCDNGKFHSLTIECDTIGVKDPCLLIRVDGKVVMQVKRLRWKFRGNYTIFVDGLPVEVFWDVYNWLFGTGIGSAVFMFETCLSAENLCTNQTFSDHFVSPLSCSRKGPRGSKLQGLGFSLILFAWKNE